MLRGEAGEDAEELQLAGRARFVAVRRRVLMSVSIAWLLANLVIAREAGQRLGRRRAPRNGCP